MLRPIVAEVNPFMPRSSPRRYYFFMLIGSIILSVSRDLLSNMRISRRMRLPSASRAMSQRLLRMALMLHVDLGRIPNETLRHLHNRRDLGIHSNVITHPVPTPWCHNHAAIPARLSPASVSVRTGSMNSCTITRCLSSGLSSTSPIPEWLRRTTKWRHSPKPSSST